MSHTNSLSLLYYHILLSKVASPTPPEFDTKSNAQLQALKQYVNNYSNVVKNFGFGHLPSSFGSLKSTMLLERWISQAGSFYLCTAAVKMRILSISTP